MTISVIIFKTMLTIYCIFLPQMQLAQNWILSKLDYNNAACDIHSQIKL